ncbi:MAG TPA: ThiF family adenylyltransferase [Planctomycetota bacterium]|nr:ThiF family adenylyltransferase [Planctomycetota bacterium]
MRYSTALTEAVHEAAIAHLARSDGQEDLCFGIWYPSRGKRRITALLHSVVLPEEGDRSVHGNAEFHPGFFERALSAALKAGGGLAFMHSHPWQGWQNMSRPDVEAEKGMAPAVLSATGLPLLGLTLGALDGAWSARFWNRTGRRTYIHSWCESVRVIGDRLAITLAEHLLPTPKFGQQLDRTISAWGPATQGIISRIRVGIVGLGSVGSIIAETLARSGISRIELIDFESIERFNLDRTLHAYPMDAEAHRSKVSISAEAIRKSAVIEEFEANEHELSVCEDDGYRIALDCDVLFSCVDRPWPRSVLNFIAYAHLIPVVDGGIYVSRKPSGRMRGADWKAHIATVGRRCLECLAQYDAGLVQAEREGHFEDPTYIQSLPSDHPVKSRQNVFAFSVATASLEILQFLSLVVAPSGIGNPGGQNYHFVTGHVDLDHGSCRSDCALGQLVGLGEAGGHPGTVICHTAAEKARRGRNQQHSRNGKRARRKEKPMG